MKPCFLLLALALSLPAHAGERNEAWAGNILGANPRVPVVGQRQLASQEIAKRDANKAVFEAAKPGDVYIVQNSIRGWEDRIVKIVDKFEDGSVRVEFEQEIGEGSSRNLATVAGGERALIRGYNLASTLSPEVGCAESHGVEICKGDQVFYPIRNTSLQLPEAPVRKVFQNGTVVVRDGADFVLDKEDLGKSVDCSPAKESICKGDYVIADAYKDTENFGFEGSVERCYTNGICVVKVDGRWRFPIEAKALKERVASLDGANNPAVITSRGEYRQKEDPKEEPLGAHTPEIPVGSVELQPAQPEDDLPPPSREVE
jgi:hypothetical protein